MRVDKGRDRGRRCLDVRSESRNADQRQRFKLSRLWGADHYLNGHPGSLYKTRSRAVPSGVLTPSPAHPLRCAYAALCAPTPRQRPPPGADSPLQPLGQRTIHASKADTNASTPRSPSPLCVSATRARVDVPFPVLARARVGGEFEEMGCAFSSVCDRWMYGCKFVQEYSVRFRWILYKLNSPEYSQIHLNSFFTL